MNNLLFDQIKNKFQTGDFASAEKLCFKLYQTQDKNINVVKNLALACMLQKKYFEAVHFYKEALNLDKLDFDVNANLAYLLSQTEDYQNALQYAQDAQNINPGSPIPQKNIGEIYLNLRKFNEAANILKQAIQISRSSKEIHQVFINELNHRYMQALSALNREDELKDFIQESLKIQLNPDIFSYQVKSFGKEIDTKILDNVKKELSNLLNNQNEVNLKLSAGYSFGLANYYLITGEKNLAEEYFIKGNSLIDLTQNYRPLETQNFIKKIIQSFKELPELNIDRGFGKDLIFIVGMPRSGTTLLESIIANSPIVHAGGEMSSFKNLIQYDVSTISKNDPDKITKSIKEYLNKINFIKSEKEKIVDKLPFNVFLIGFIVKLLPSAKIILIDRNPWDIATSLFQQFYVGKHYYSTKFFNIAMQIANYNFIKKYWLNLDIDHKNIYEIQYEDLVGESEKYSKEIYDHLGIDHSLNLENRKKFYSSTASFSQVRGDISSKSIKKELFDDYKNQFFDDLNGQYQYWDNFNL